MAWKERYMEAVDVETSYRLAKEMESYRSNPKLGYRPAGSRAEFETGERLKKEMEAMGLSMSAKTRSWWTAGSLKKRSLHTRTGQGTPAGRSLARTRRIL